MLKGLLLSLLVLGGPVHAQLAHFCDVMEQAVETCCCGHDEQPLQVMPAGCSEVADPCCRTVVSLVEDGAAAISPTGKLGASAHDPPPLGPPFNANLPSGAPCSTLPAAHSRPGFFGHGTRTYLRTLRLRL